MPPPPPEVWEIRPSTAVFAMNGKDVVLEEVVWGADRCSGQEVQLLGKALLTLTAQPLPGPDSWANHSLRARTLYSCPHPGSTVRGIELLGVGVGNDRARVFVRGPDGPA